ncbi:hypothetical protein GCM10008915_40280 [Bifidobacterium pullorum subsp. gallinarum]
MYLLFNRAVLRITADLIHYIIRETLDIECAQNNYKQNEQNQDNTNIISVAITAYTFTRHT